MGEAEASENPDSFATLSRLCNHRFWDVSEAWESWAPERWMCAERTLLAWMPCFYLWLIAPFYFLFIRRRPYDPLPWTPLTSTKVVVSFLFLVVSIVELMWAALDYRPITPPVHFITPLIVMATQCLHIGFVILDRRNGQRSSGVLWIFWFLVLFCGIPQIITTFDTLVHKDGNGLPLTLVVTFLLQYLSTLTIFIANCFCDEPSKSQRRNRTKFPSPEMDASFPNKIFYFWCKDLIWKGWRRPITEDDLWDTLHKNETHVIHDAWETATQREQKTHKDVMVKMEKKAENLYDNNIGSDCRAEPISLGWGIWRLTRFDLFIAFLLYVVAEGTYFITPLLLGLLIQFVTDLNEVSWHGYLYAVSMLLVCQISSIIRNQYYQTVLVLSVRVHSALMTAVYRKTLSLSGSARRESTLGQIVNIMAVDSDSIGDVYFYSGVLLGSPLVILVSLGLLWQRLGPSVLAGLGVLLLIIPLNSLLANKCKDIQTLASKIRDKRVKMVSEIVNGIKVLKLYAWEASFAAKVEAVRKEEIALMRRKALIQAFSFFLFQASPYLVSLATFSTYLLVSEENILDAETAFVAISLFNIMRLPIVQMPGVISGLVQANVALKRMQKYISSEELDSNAVCSDPSADSAVVVRGGNFQWEGDEQNWYLRDINFKVDEGHLVAIVGSVGAGKSSLISALLGEMKKASGKVIINGTLAYVSQQAWLQNATLRDNITWGQPFNETRYKEVVHACALKQDLDMLPAGDMTEIGEKGINLSGGQKQRVALARAVYSEADIFLLDDPLSAVDAHVGRHIFDQAIGPRGILQGRTRVLVTHAVTYLPQVDQVLVVQDGRLVEKGSYTELVANGEDFANFVLQHINTDNDEDLEELAELIDQLEVVPGGQALLRQISHQSSRGSESIVMKSPDGNPSTQRYRSISECEPRQQRHYPQVPPRPSPNGSCPTVNGHLLASTGDDEESRSIASLHSMALELDIANGSASVIPHSEAAENTLGNGSLTHMKDPKRHQRCDLISYKAIDSETDKKVEPGDSGRKLVDEEYVETGKVAQKIYIDYAKAMGVAFAILPVIFLFLAQASVAGANTWLSHWASSQTPILANTNDNTTNTDVVGRDMFLFVYGALGLSQAFFLYMGVSVVLLGCLRGSRVLHQSLLDAVIHFPMSFFDTNPSGRIINRFSKEINVLDVKLSSTIRSTISTLTKVVTTLVVLIAATPAVTVFILPIMVVYYFIQVVFVATSRQLKRIASLTRPPIYTHFSETIQGLSVIRAYRKQDEFFQESLQRIGHYLKATFVNLNVERWLAVQLEMIGNLITFAASIVAVAGRETISPGLVGLTVTYALNITGMMNWLVRVVSDLEAHIVSVERIIEYVKKDQEAPWVVSSHRPPLDWPQEGGVQFNNYETRYRPGLELVLKGITCSFRPSEKVGIVGRTGAGKSSLTLALFRLIESAGGNIHIDDVTISKLGLHDLRSRISIIPQDPVLFSGTVRLNLDPFDDRSDADIWQALELAHLSDYIRSQPLGLQHVVDEDGSNFSVGQRQLMCLARALLRSSQVLVLDEATAAVDLETDNLIQTTIRNQFAHCTVLTIAHRLNTIMDSDRVLVLDMGKIAEFDTPAALLQNTDSLFHGMAKDAGLI